MNIVKEYHAKIDTLSVEIAESIAKIPSLPREHHDPGVETHLSMATHLEWLILTRDIMEKGLSAYQKAHRLAVANLS
tara:strand:+ start:479 stop:709 length:231 start_codon:yes stop_codon:yes gene_type:complete